MNEKTKGGKRPNAGRKKVDDPKQTISLYIETSIITAAGGKEALQNKLYNSMRTEKKPWQPPTITPIPSTPLPPEEDTPPAENNPPEETVTIPTWDRTIKKESWVQYKERLTAWSNKK